LEQNQNVLICSRIFFKTVFPTGSLTTSTGTFLASATLSRPQLTFSGTSSGLSQPINISRPLSTLSRPLLTLSQPLKHSQGLCSLQALNWLVTGNSQVLSHGCESVVEAVRVLYTLAASLGSPTITMGTLMASTCIFRNSTTLTQPTLILMGP
jgi:hypothetical protein